MASDREDPETRQDRRINGDHAELAPGDEILIVEDEGEFAFDDDLFDDDEELVIEDEEDEDGLP